MDSFSFIFFPFITAFLFTVLATPACIYLLKKLKIMDNPDRKHPGIVHKKPIPRGGGIPLFIGAFLAALIFLPPNGIVVALFVAALLSLIVGVLDDKYDVSPYTRFVMNFLSAGIVVLAGANIPFITNPFGGILFLNNIQIPFLNIPTDFFSYFLAVIWIVWVMNMLNWSKGVDGQMPGIVAISAFVIGLLSLRFAVLDQNNLIAATLSFIIAGSALGFLVFNFYPAKIFPGYGATAIYLFLSVVSILSSAKLATAILVMGVPLVDGSFTIIRRIISGKSPFWHDNKHLHHILLKAGLSQRKIALFYWFFSAILGTIALNLSSKGKFFAIAMLVIIVGGGIIFLHLSTKGPKNENGV